MKLEVINLKVPLKAELQLNTEVENFTKIINSTIDKYTINYERRDSSISYPVKIHVKVEEKCKARKGDNKLAIWLIKLF